MRKPYKEYLKSTKWKNKRKSILKFNNRCNRCGTTKALQVHHLNYKRIGKERAEDLVVLCKGCHRSVHMYHVNPFKRYNKVKW